MLTCSHVAAPSSHTFDSKRPESELWEPEEVTNEMDPAETKWAMFVTMFEGPVENRVKKAINPSHLSKHRSIHLRAPISNDGEKLPDTARQRSPFSGSLDQLVYH